MVSHTLELARCKPCEGQAWSVTPRNWLDANPVCSLCTDQYHVLNSVTVRGPGGFCISDEDCLGWLTFPDLGILSLPQPSLPRSLFS